MNAEARQRLQKAVQAKVDRLSKNPRITAVIPFEELERGAWYVGDCWCGHVALWDGEFFITFKDTSSGYKQVVEIGYATNREGACKFVPYKRIPNPR